MVCNAEQGVGIGRQVHAHEVGFFVDDMVEKALRHVKVGIQTMTA